MTTTTCAAHTRYGTPCGTRVMHGSSYCYQHDPAVVTARAMVARDPVRVRTRDDVLALLERTINDTLNLENSLERARTLAMLAGAVMRVLEKAG